MQQLRLEMVYGLILAFSSLVWLWLEYVSGLHTTYKSMHPLLSNLYLLPYVIITAIGVYSRKKDFGGMISYKQAFSSGLMMGVFAALLSPLVMMIFHYLINPNFFNDFAQYAIAQKLMSAEQAKMYFSLKSYMLQAASGTMVQAAIISAILGLMFKNKK